MIKSLKSLTIVMIILSLLCFAGGVGFSKLSEANRGTKITSGRMINGKFVPSDVGVIGANKQGEETAKAMAIVLYGLSVVSMLAGIAFAATVKKKNNLQVTKKHGIILEKQILNNYESVIVEFDDGIRKKLLVEPPLIVAKGDKGVLGSKGNLLVEFSKEL